MELIQVVASVVYIIIMALFWYMAGAGVERWPFKGFPADVARALTDKRWRRYGAPIATLVYGFIMAHWWQAPLAATILYVGTILPITFTGEDVLENWWWQPIHGFIYGSTALAMSLLGGWLWGVIAAAIVAILYAFYIILFTKIDEGNDFDWWAVQELFTPVTIGSAIVLMAW